MKLLEHAHFNRAGVRPSDYEALIEDYMLELDPNRLFLIEPDRSALAAKHAKNIYTELAKLGTTRTGSAIVEAYRSRAYARVHWIKRELAKQADFSADEYYSLAPQRGWLPNLDAADEVWRRRLKHELLNEVVNGKSEKDASEIVARRYDDFLRHTEGIDSTDQAEWFLTAVCRLFDAESAYYSFRTFAEFARPKALAGIGATFERQGTDLRVKGVVAETSADGKLRPGDRLLAIGDEGGRPVDAFGLTVRQLESRLPGPAGTKVELTVARGAYADPSRHQQLALTRTPPTLQPTRARLMVTPGNPAVAVVTLPSLYGVLDTEDGATATSSTEDVARPVKDAMTARAAGIVFDLRGNGGGYLSEAMALAGLFVGPRLITYIRHYDGTLKQDMASQRAVYDGPLVVLVDRLTGSGAEIVAGALQCYGRAIIVGAETTWGNGTVQQVLEMKQLSKTLALRGGKTGAAKITIQKFYLPDGNSPQLRGIRSDIPIRNADDLVWEGEAGLRRPLSHDTIRPDRFEPTPLDSRLLQSLREASEQRQLTMPEFARVRKIIDRFRTSRSGQISLHLQRRMSERREDDQLWSAVDERDVSLHEAIRILNDLIGRRNRPPPGPP